MAKCAICHQRKGKRYCQPLDKVICSKCCGKSRLDTIDCNKDCRYLAGVEFQRKKDEEKELNELMHNVPHGSFDDIYQKEEVAQVAYNLESIVGTIYANHEDIYMTDTKAYNAYKNLYLYHSEDRELKEKDIDDLSEILLNVYEENKEWWEENLGDELLGQLFLRLMLSVKNMSGGRMGEFGYLNYLKNNMINRSLDDGFIMEDKFGNKIKKSYDEI